MVQVDLGGLLYEIDEYGNISKRRNHKGFLKTYPDKDGYERVSVTNKHGVTYNEALHRVMWRAWHGPIPEGMTVDHIDDDKTHNHKDNFQLLSAADNVVKGNARNWIVTSPDGKETLVYNLRQFCRDHGLHKSHLYEHGKYKGWKAR